MKIQKVLLSLIVILSSILILGIKVHFNNKNNFKLTNYNEFKKELMQKHKEIYKVELSYWHIGVDIIIYTNNAIPYNKQMDIFNNSRRYLIDNYNEIDDFFIKKNKFCSELTVTISPKELKGTYISSNYYTLKDHKLDYFKTWYYYDISTHKTTQFICDDKGVERKYPNVKEEISRRENVDE
ncbi:MAG: hypothetical protein ACPKPY_11135 [Nitrososphaeraceae archaeon]